MTFARALFERFQWAIPRSLKDVAELSYASDKYLAATGWTRSRQEKMAVDQEGRPLPWYTYPAISFLKPRIRSAARVFEFGMGNSTLWWSGRAAKVTACETDQGWFDRIVATMPANVEALLQPVDSPAYPTAAADRGELVSILVIDGRRRVECVQASADVLSRDAVVIWDNSERERYTDGLAFLHDRGFRQLDFWGLGPLNLRAWCTSVLYRDGNCLGI